MDCSTAAHLHMLVQAMTGSLTTLRLTCGYGCEGTKQRVTAAHVQSDRLADLRTDWAYDIKQSRVVSDSEGSVMMSMSLAKITNVSSQ